MKKYIDIGLKIVFSLILFMPILGVTGVFPPPTADLYNTPDAFDFILVLNEVKYITYTMVLVFAVALGLIWTKRMGLAALLVLPITVNVVGFHAFLDGGLFTGGAVLGNIMLLLNLYFIWQEREKYRQLVKPAF